MPFEPRTSAASPAAMETSMPKSPPPADAARALYADAFEPTSKRELARSLADWAELSVDEQSFTVAHLLYLNLQAQGGAQRALVQVRALLDELAEGLTRAIEALPTEHAHSNEDLDRVLVVEDEVPAPIDPGGAP